GKRHCSAGRTLANLWTRLRSPRPNRATGGYLLTGTSAPREDEFVAGRRHLQEQEHLGRRGYAAAAEECLINVTDFSDIQISGGTGEAAGARTITELRVPTITTTNIGNTTSNTCHSNSSIINGSNINNSNTSSSNSNSNSNMSRIIQPRYRFRDLLLGDFSFNDDGER
ncbi:hypothetical protein KR059_012606, partial [Drosophila kikkawai]